MNAKINVKYRDTHVFLTVTKNKAPIWIHLVKKSPWLWRLTLLKIGLQKWQAHTTDPDSWIAAWTALSQLRFKNR